jgi:hypothetical protein
MLCRQVSLGIRQVFPAFLCPFKIPITYASSELHVFIALLLFRTKAMLLFSSVWYARKTAKNFSRQTFVLSRQDHKKSEGQELRRSP